MAIQNQSTKNDDLSVTLLLAGIFHGVLQAAMHRQIVPTIISGFLYTILQSEPQSWLWTPYGMLLGTAIGLMFDEEAGLDLDGPFDRVDHAAFAVALGILVHFLIYI